MWLLFKNEKKTLTFYLKNRLIIRLLLPYNPSRDVLESKKKKYQIKRQRKVLAKRFIEMFKIHIFFSSTNNKAKKCRCHCYVVVQGNKLYSFFFSLYEPHYKSLARSHVHKT